MFYRSKLRLERSDRGWLEPCWWDILCVGLP